MILWWVPREDLQRRRLATCSPGRVLSRSASHFLFLHFISGSIVGHSHAAVEVHTVDTNTGVVLDTQVNVFADTETEVTGLGEVLLSQLVLLDLEATLENLLSLGATDGDVDGDLFVTTDTEGTDGVTGLAYSHTNQISARSFFLQKFLTEVSLL